MNRAIMILLLVCGPALGQSAQPAEQPAPPVEQPGDQPKELPSLDDLLGLEEEEPTSDEHLDADALDPAANDLDRRLSDEELSDEMRQAVALMEETADRLNVSGDTGLITQRLQDDILLKLDIIIKTAQQQQSKSGSSSSSSQQEQQQQQPNQQQSQGQGQGDNTQENMPPGRQDGELNPLLATAQAAWGALPDRVRDSLLQGSSDRFSSLYQSLTESYYERLAEEPE